MAAPICFKCGKELGLAIGNIGRSETCPHCSADVRVCYNCKHYNPNTYNECSEPNADRVVDKDRRNFCDYFYLWEGVTKRSAGKSKEDMLKSLDNLFKK